MSHLTRRAALALPALLLARGAAGQGWAPARPLRFVVGFAAGGATDFVARVVAPEMTRVLGQPVVVENRTGAVGNLATQAVTAAPADGLTLGFAGLQLATNPALIAGLGYDPETDLQMVGQFTALPVVVMASARSGIRTLAEAIARAKEREVIIGTAGVGTSSHLGAELLFRHVGGRFTPVQFRGGGPAFQALLSGDAEMMFDLVAAYQAPAVAEGAVRMLGVMQAERAVGLPDVPSFAELGLPAEAQMRSWQGLFVRAGTPAPAIAALHRATVEAVRSPAVAERLRGISMDPVASESPAAFHAFYRAELARWTRLIRDAGIRAQ